MPSDWGYWSSTSTSSSTWSYSSYPYWFYVEELIEEEEPKEKHLGFDKYLK